VPQGLLFCLRRTLDRRELQDSIAFWDEAAVPAPAVTAGADVHVQMLAFAYAWSRFALAEALTEAGDVPRAHAQLAALLATGPDDTEDAIAEAMKAVGRTRFRRVALGVRALEMLSAGS
jgi:hypothetical protein